MADTTKTAYQQDAAPSSGLRRRSFLKLGLAASGMVLSQTQAWGDMMGFLHPVNVQSPFDAYPNRDWEQAYRDLYKADSTFHFLCAPNDTHNCLLTAYVKNAVVVRIGPSFGYGKATDLDGNQASHRWDPRCCQKGLALVRRFYGDRRVKAPMVRQGFKAWVEAGFPRDPETGKVPEQYLNRGREPFVQVTWDEAFTWAARAMQNIAETYNGAAGMRKLAAQGYDEAMVAAVKEAGVQTLKFRGGMAALGATRIFAQYRLANMMALLDAKSRGVEPDKALGARGWDNYSWHTDLPPGHPMVTGHQTVDWDLSAAEHARLILVWGMNWITTKMPDSHWLTEARLKGTKVITIAAEYSATASKSDAVLIVRPGTTPALALGLIHVIIKEALYDAAYIRQATDLPLLVRDDTHELLRAQDVFPNYTLQPLSNHVTVVPQGKRPPAGLQQAGPVLHEDMRKAWGDYVVYDTTTQKLHALSRDHVGPAFEKLGLIPALEGTFTAQLSNGQSVTVRPVFEHIKRLVMDSYDPATVSEITWAPVEAIHSIARQIAQHAGQTLFALGMGPNQFFNNDLKDRAVFLLASLTRSIGRIGGNVGSYAGNYRAAYFNGLVHYFIEDPFNIELDPQSPVQ
ncbi:MAG: molybdopterin-dependent oxidoreductase [Candidatus Tectimicrobiota bacterium]